MKKLFLLLSIIFLAIGCSKDDFLDEVPKSTIEEPTKETQMSLEDWYRIYTHGYEVKDTTGLGLTSANIYENNDSVYIAGLRQGRLWAAGFNKSSKKELFSYSNKDLFSVNRKIYKGYGEYINTELRRIDVSYANRNRFLLLAKSSDDVIYGYTEYFIWYPEYERFHSLIHEDLHEWYGNSVLVKMGDEKGLFTCISEKGDSLFSGASNHFGGGDVFPVSYKDFISFSSDIIWDNETESYSKYGIRVYLASLEEYPLTLQAKLLGEYAFPKTLNFRYSVVLLTKVNDVYKFRVDITEYSGEKHFHEVEIDFSKI